MVDHPHLNLLNTGYQDATIQSAAFYADPEDMLQNQKELRETLQAFVATQEATTPFALQVLATHGVVTLRPLGLFALDEVKTWEHEQRTALPVGAPLPEPPLVVTFQSHVDEAENTTDVLNVTQSALFADFTTSFRTIWQAVVAGLTLNQRSLYAVTKKLAANQAKATAAQTEALQTLSDDQRETQVGFVLPDEAIPHYAAYLADLQQVNAILLASATFVKEQLLQTHLFAQMMNLAQERNTFFWVLDNTFNEIVYFYIATYGKQPAVAKRLQTLRKQLAPKLRTQAWQQADQLLKDNAAFEPQRFFGELFLPLAEQLEVTVAEMAGEGK